jgi:hypothetical protein
VRIGVIKREEEREHEGSEKNTVHALLEITCDTEYDKSEEEIINFKFAAILL